jgi:hypothetical protein
MAYNLLQRALTKSEFKIVVANNAGAKSFVVVANY